jgi:hypothetical protein
MPSIGFTLGDNRVIVKEHKTGLDIYVNGKCLALVDLFYLMEDGADELDGEEEFAQVVLYTGDDGQDPLAHVRWYENRIEVSLDQSYGWDGKDRGVYREFRTEELE